MSLSIDPVTGEMRFTLAGVNVLGPAPRPPVPQKRLTPEEEQSLLSLLGRGSLGALSYVGETLAKPSRALWGSLSYLSGKPAGGGLLNLIPFSDTLGITDPAKAVEASDFLENVGAIPQNKPGFDVLDPVRFGLDVVGDPLTWVGFGAVGKVLSKGGRAAKAAGLLDYLKLAAPTLGKRAALETKTIDDILSAVRKMDKPLAKELEGKLAYSAEKAGHSLDELRKMRLGGMYGVGFPFGEIRYLIGGMKPLPRPSLSARAADALSGLFWTGQSDIPLNVAKRLAPGDIEKQNRIYQFGKALSAPGRTLRMLFSPKTRGMFDPIDQAAGEMGYWAAKGAEPIAYEIGMKSRNLMDKAIEKTYREQERLLNKVFKNFGNQPTPNVSGAVTGVPGAEKFSVADVVLDPQSRVHGIITDIDSDTKEFTIHFIDPVHGTAFRKKVPAEEIPLFKQIYPSGTPGAEEYARAVYSQSVGSIARHVAETKDLNEAIELTGLDLGRLAEIAGIQGWKPTKAMEKAFQRFGNYTVRENRKIHRRFLQMGGRSSMLEGFDQEFRHFPRRAQQLRYEDRLRREGIRQLETRNRFARARRPELRTVPTAVIERALGLPELREGTIEDALTEALQDKYISKYMSRAYGLRDAMKEKFKGVRQGRKRLKLTSDDPRKVIDELEPFVGRQEAEDAVNEYLRRGEGKVKHARDFVEWIRTNPKRKFILGEEKFYGLDPVRDELAYQLASQRATRAIQAVHQLFAENLIAPHLNRQLPPVRGAGMMPIKRAYAQLGLNSEQAYNFFKRQFADILGQADEKTAMIPTDVVQAARAIIAPNRLPETFERILSLTDPFLRSWKLGVTTPWAAFHVRNHVSGQHLNATVGLESLADFPKYAKEYRKALRWANAARKGRQHEIPKWLREEIESQNLLGDIGFYDVPLQRATYEGVLPEGLLPWRKAREEAAIDVATRPAPILDLLPGGKKIRRAFGTVTRVGGNVTQYVEWMNRVPLYTYLREKGYSAAQAARRVKEIHFDYGDLSPFERVVMRRVMPFYTFSRKATELVANELLSRPGGLLGQTIRLGRGGYQDSPYLPEYIAQTTAVPLPTEGPLAAVLGTPPKGTKRYLSSFGLAHEDPLTLIFGGEWLSRLHPFIKGSIEWGTGTSLFHRGPSGARALEDVDPTVGRIITNIQEQLTGEHRRPRPFVSRGFEFALANSPISRLLTTLRTATDPRKIDWTFRDKERRGGALLANLLTGFRVTDVSPAAQQEALRANVNKLIRHLPGGRRVETVWIPEDLKAILSEEELATYEAASKLRSILEREARKAAKQIKLDRLRERRRREREWWESQEE